MPDRNDLCPCSSGKKYKKCCLKKAVNYGPCSAERGCNKPSSGATDCKMCGKRYAHCFDHQAEVQVAIRGHVLRVHPESVSGAVDLLIRNKTQLAALRVEAERNPELWRHLFEYIEERQRAQG